MDINGYICTHEDYFFRWEENGDVLAIPGGSTICYTSYLTEVISHLSLQKLPPLGALLLAIIATNPGSDAARDQVHHILTRQVNDKSPWRADLDNAIAFMNVLMSLPDGYKRGEKRLQVFQTIFRHFHNSFSRKKAMAISHIFATGNYQLKDPIPFQIQAFSRDFRGMALLKDTFYDASVVLEQIAALPQTNELPLLPEQPLTADAPQKDFITELLEHSSTFHVAALIRRLWSGLHIPFHHSHPSDQQFGGVSDLSNKGEFDKLLVSEFANDDLVFLSRLANSEALYVNREMPPLSNKKQRMVILDVSLRNWGTPKIIAHALLLAIARHPKTDIACRGFIVGKGYREVGFHNIHEIIDSLQYPDDGLHAAQGLEQFFTDKLHEGNTELFFISSEAGMKQAAVQKIMSDHHDPVHYRITTTAAGVITVYQKRHQGKKLVQEIKLPVQQLWSQAPEKAKALQAQLPERPFPPRPGFPLLLPRMHDPKKLLLANTGDLIVITHEKDVLRLNNYKQHKYDKGLELLYEKLPVPMGLFACGVNSDSQLLLLCFSPSNKELTVLNLDTETIHRTTFNEWRHSYFEEFFFHKDHFYCFNRPEYWQIDAGTELSITHFNAATGRAYRQAAEMQKKEFEGPVKILEQSGSVLRNIHVVHIDYMGILSLNWHELKLNASGNLVLESNKTEEKNNTLTIQGKGTFTFPDGSRIIVGRNGMIALKSSDQRIPSIFLPAVMEVSLAAATDRHFAGNKHFYHPGYGQEMINMAEFYSLYLKAFTATILHHAGKT